MRGDKGYLSDSLRTLETGSLSVIGRSSGKADYLMLTPEGRHGLENSHEVVI